MGSIKLQLLRVIHISLIWVAPSPFKMDLILFLEGVSQGGLPLLNKTRGWGKRCRFACSRAVLLSARADFMLEYLL